MTLFTLYKQLYLISFSEVLQFYNVIVQCRRLLLVLVQGVDLIVDTLCIQPKIQSSHMSYRTAYY